MTNFDQFELSSELLNAIVDMGFESPSEIQAKAIPSLMQSKDILGQAQTGTGKTAAFAIPAIEKIDLENQATQILVLCPTRELVVQVAGEFEKLGKYHHGLSTLAVYGGQDINVQLRALKKGVQVVVGTPGRVMDHMRRKTLDFSQLSYVVLDEADQMLDMGFREDMETILADTPKDRQTVMFSATMPKTLMNLMKKFQNDPDHINTVGEQAQSKQINQLYFHINKASKKEAIKRLLIYYKVKSALIFCNTKHMVDELSKELSDNNYSIASLHGDIDQKKRDRAMKRFKDGAVQLVIATDVAARGLDIDDLEAVINYDLPRFDQDYVHRIGRTGRAGKAGLALSIVVGNEIDLVNRIARKTNMKIEPSKIPATHEMERAGFDSLKNLLQNTNFKRKDLKKYGKLLDDLELYEYSHDELAAVMLKAMLDQEKKSFEKNINFEPEKKKNSSGNKSGSQRSSRKGSSSMKQRQRKGFSNRSSSGTGKRRFEKSSKKKRYNKSK